MGKERRKETHEGWFYVCAAYDCDGYFLFPERQNVPLRECKVGNCRYVPCKEIATCLGCEEGNFDVKDFLDKYCGKRIRITIEVLEE